MSRIPSREEIAALRALEAEVTVKKWPAIIGIAAGMVAEEAEYTSALRNAAPSLLDAAEMLHKAMPLLRRATNYGEDWNDGKDSPAARALVDEFFVAIGSLVPCAAQASGDCDTLIPAGSGPSYTGYCETCGEVRADAVAASLPGQEIENEAWS